MEKIGVIVPCFNKIGLAREYVRSMAVTRDQMTEFIMIDDHSSDGTAGYLMGLSAPFRGVCNDSNIGMVKSFNRGASLTDADILVFMHNDVVLHLAEWPEVFRRFFSAHTDGGVAGLYGARRIRGDGSFMGRGIVHAKAQGGNLRGPSAQVAVVDGLLMAMPRSVYNAIGGFDGAYRMHYYDKDICLRAREAGFKNYVVNIPFTHRGAGTRSSVKAEEDSSLRESMRQQFLARWQGKLPFDVRSLSGRFRDRLRCRG